MSQTKNKQFTKLSENKHSRNIRAQIEATYKNNLKLKTIVSFPDLIIKKKA